MGRQSKNNRPEIVFEKVNIYDFLNYRAYLKTVYEKRKAVDYGFSFRFFARMAGLGGQSYLRMVMDGKRNLSAASAAKFATALQLNKRESHYFEALVFHNQADNEADRDRYFSQILSLRPATKITGVTSDQLEYASSPLYVTLREMTAMPEFVEDVAWINDHLTQRVKPAEIRRALEVLEKLGLLIRDEQGQLKHSGLALQTPVDIESPEVLNYHRSALSESKDAILTAPPGEWDVASMTIPIPKEELAKIMDVLQKCREDIVGLINAGTRNFHEIYQINMQMFPVTKIKRV